MRVLELKSSGGRGGGGGQKTVIPPQKNIPMGQSEALTIWAESESDCLVYIPPTPCKRIICEKRCKCLV